MFLGIEMFSDCSKFDLSDDCIYKVYAKMVNTCTITFVPCGLSLDSSIKARSPETVPKKARERVCYGFIPISPLEKNA